MASLFEDIEELKEKVREAEEEFEKLQGNGAVQFLARTNALEEQRKTLLGRLGEASDDKDRADRKATLDDLAGRISPLIADAKKSLPANAAAPQPASPAAAPSVIALSPVTPPLQNDPKIIKPIPDILKDIGRDPNGPGSFHLKGGAEQYQVATRKKEMKREEKDTPSSSLLTYTPSENAAPDDIDKTVKQMVEHYMFLNGKSSKVYLAGTGDDLMVKVGVEAKTKGLEIECLNKKVLAEIEKIFNQKNEPPKLGSK